MKIKTKNMCLGVCGFKTTLPTNYTPSKTNKLTYTKLQCLSGFDSVFSLIKKHQYDRLPLGGVG